MFAKPITRAVFFLSWVMTAACPCPLLANEPSSVLADQASPGGKVTPEMAAKYFFLGVQRMQSNPQQMEGYLAACVGRLASGDYQTCVSLINEAKKNGVRQAAFLFEVSKIFLKYGFPPLAIIYLESAERAWLEEPGQKNV